MGHDAAAKEVLGQFGRAVRLQRTRLGLSQEQFAELVGLHRTYVGGIERGERNVSLLNIAAIARALGVPVGVLFEGAAPTGMRDPSNR